MHSVVGAVIDVIACCYPVNLQHSSCKLIFSIRLENSVDPDQMASDLDLKCSQNLINSGSAGQGLNAKSQELAHMSRCLAKGTCWHEHPPSTRISLCISTT